MAVHGYPYERERERSSGLGENMGFDKGLIHAGSQFLMKSIRTLPYEYTNVKERVSSVSLCNSLWQRANTETSASLIFLQYNLFEIKFTN